MKNIFELTTYDFEGYDNKTFIITDMDKKEFEKKLIELNKKSLENKELISNVGHFDNIISMLEKEGCEIGLFYNDSYILTDNEPLPNSTFWEKEDTNIIKLE